MRGQRIAYVLPSLDIGGMEQFTVQLAAAMLARGHSPTIVVTSHEGALADVARAQGISVGVARIENRWGNFVPTALLRHLRASPADVVHSQNGVWLPAAVAARMSGAARMIHTEHGLQSEQEPWASVVMKTIAARATNSIVSVSTPLLGALAEHAHVPPSRIVRIDNGIPLPPPDSDGAMRRTMRANLEVDEQTFVIGAVARLDPLKGIDVLLRALPSLESIPASVKVVLVGDGAERQSLEALAARTRIPVQFLGMRRDVRQLLYAFDGYVLPSRSEGLPLALLEAMAAGVPVVATRVGEVATVLREGALGSIVAPENPEALAAALTALIQSHDAARRKASDALVAVQQHYGIDQMVDQYEALYRA